MRYLLYEMCVRTVIFLHLCIMLYIIYWPISVDSCNEAVCASVVSRCLLTEACKCDLQNCTCCKDCYLCLEHVGLWTECCSCVGMCPRPNNTKTGLSNASSVEDLKDSIPSLFSSLVSESDSLERWIPLTFPVDHNTDTLKLKNKKVSGIAETNVQEVDPEKNTMTLNCSVAFMSECMPWNQCRASCQSMGASRIRWFHDGCCECIGDICASYGVDENRCGCSSKLIPSDAEVELDYGEDEHLEL